MEKVFEEFNHEIKADKNHAQILIEITPASKTLGEVRKIIEDLVLRFANTLTYFYKYDEYHYLLHSARGR